MANIIILVGTESGNSQMVADYLSDELTPQGHVIEVFDQANLDEIAFATRDTVLVCTSTHGDGQMPCNLSDFFERLQTQRPDLQHIRYGVIALGDQTYHETFCRAGKLLDNLFAELGATRVGERLEIDACTQPLPDEDALEWATEWVDML